MVSMKQALKELRANQEVARQTAEYIKERDRRDAELKEIRNKK